MPLPQHQARVRPQHLARLLPQYMQWGFLPDCVQNLLHHLRWQVVQTKPLRIYRSRSLVSLLAKWSPKISSRGSGSAWMR